MGISGKRIRQDDKAVTFSRILPGGALLETQAKASEISEAFACVSPISNSGSGRTAASAYLSGKKPLQARILHFEHASETTASSVRPFRVKALRTG